jgi:hypothetical protein
MTFFALLKEFWGILSMSQKDLSTQRSRRHFKILGYALNKDDPPLPKGKGGFSKTAIIFCDSPGARSKDPEKALPVRFCYGSQGDLKQKAG